MKKCKDCVHYCRCKDTVADENWRDEVPAKIKEMFSPQGCEDFKHADDLESVVRCKDCIHNVANWNHDELDETDYTDITCDFFMTDGMEPNDYCSYGVLKEREG